MRSLNLKPESAFGRLSRQLLALMFVCVATLASNAQAGWCSLEEGQKSGALETGPELESTSKDDAQDVLGFEIDARAGTEVVETIVPCAFIESGAFGAFCADATVYVVTDAGLVLCTLPMLTFESDPELEKRVVPHDATPTSSYTTGLHLAANMEGFRCLKPPTVLLKDDVAAGPARLLGPQDRSLSVPVSPC